MWLPEQLVPVSHGAQRATVRWSQAAHLVPLLLLAQPTPRRRRLSSAVFSCLPVLFVFSDDCLRSERLLQLPGLERSGQQRGHQSDGWWLHLTTCATARHGAEGGSRVTVQSGLASPRPLLSDHQTWARPTLRRNQDPFSGLARVCTHMACKEASNSRDRFPIPLIQQKVTGDTGLTVSALSLEGFSVQG